MPLYYVEEQTMSCKKDSEYYEKRVSKLRKYFRGVMR
jgi:hypothetical protein